MTSRPRTAKQAAAIEPKPVKKAPTKRPTAAVTRAPRKRNPRKATTAKLSLVKPRKELPTREKPFMTDTQGYATLAARIVGIPTIRIRDWRDHRDNTCTRRLRNGSTLHYNLNTRTLTWQAVCRMGAIHQYVLASHSMACAARLHADGCKQPHADLTTIPPLTPDERKELGLTEIQDRTLARPDLLDDITETIPVPLPDQRERALADTLTHSSSATDETQPMSTQAIADHIAEQLAAEQPADTDQTREHPQP